MERWSGRRDRLREIVGGSVCVYPASVFDPISARCALDLGFEMGMYAGSVASWTVLGAPDIVALTLTEFADQALRIARAAPLPLLADADHGYGNAINVMRTVEELEIAGIAGLSIEDTELPTPFGSGGTPRLISIEEGVGKMRAALAARCDSRLVIAGRTSAPSISGIADAIRRVKAYEQAGVDVLFLVGVQTRAALDEIVGAVRLPVVLGAAGAELFDQPYLASRGVRICLQGHQPFMTAVRAIRDTMKALREGVQPRALVGADDDALMKSATRHGDVMRHIDRYLSP